MYFYRTTSVGVSVVITVLWNRSRQSVIIASALHESLSNSSGLFVVNELAGTDPDPDVQFMAQDMLAATWVAAAVPLSVKYDPQLGRSASEASTDGQLT